MSAAERRRDMRKKLERRRSRSADSLRRMISESKQVSEGGHVRQIAGVNGETDFEVLHRKSEDDMVGTIQRKSVNHRRVGSDGVGGGGEGGERASQKVEVGLLLAMDYSGMDELEQGQAALDDTALLAGVDGQVSEGRRRTVLLQPCHLPRPPAGRPTSEISECPNTSPFQHRNTLLVAPKTPNRNNPIPHHTSSPPGPDGTKGADHTLQKP